MAKVLVAPMFLAGVECSYQGLLRAANFEPVFPPRPVQLSEEELQVALRGVAAAIAGSEPYTRRVIESNPQLRVIARFGVGYDKIDLQAATANGVVVTIAPGTNQDAVAEHTLALILALAKDLFPRHLATRDGRWPRKASQAVRRRMLGLVGLGRIGKAVALRAACFGMRLLAYDPFPDLAFIRRHGITLATLEQVLSGADFLSLHLPLSAESRHLINARTLALMKPTAFLINTARGEIVCEADLAAALRSGRLAGAALDVFEKEPAEDNPLFEFENVLLTPHTAGIDMESLNDMALSAARAIVSLARGEWPADQIVNPEVRTKFAGLQRA